MPKITDEPIKRSKLVLEFQRQVGAYPRAYVLDGDMRIADITFVGMNESLKKIVDVFRQAGVRITTDDHQPIRAK